MPENFVTPPMLPTSSNLPQTPFSAIIAQQSKSSVSEKSGVHLQVGMPGEKTIKEVCTECINFYYSLYLNLMNLFVLQYFIY